MIENKLQHCYENYSFLKRIYDIESRPVVGNYGPGEDSEIFNQASEAYGVASHAEGGGTKTGEYAMYAHAEGDGSEANGISSHAEGQGSIATGQGSHTEGYVTRANADYSHAEGDETQANGIYSHAEGYKTSANGESAHVEGDHCIADGDSSHAEGYCAEAFGVSSHAEGSNTQALGDYSHAEGESTVSNGMYSHVEGYGTIVSSEAPEAQHVQGKYNIEDTDGIYVHIIGYGEDDSNRKNIHTIDTLGNAMFTGKVTVGDGSSIPEPSEDGDLITKKYFDDNSSSGGVGQNTDGMSWNKNETDYTGKATAEIFNDYVNNIASGNYSHAEGSGTVASGGYSHAEGYNCISSGTRSHAEGYNTKASNAGSHSEGYYTTASGNFGTHAEGYNTIASGNASHAQGWGTKASSDYQHVEGKYNVEDTDDTYVHIVGWGASDTARKNIHTIDTSGNAVFAGSCTATSHPTSSSRRFKENFRDVDISESEKILNLKAQKFDFKEEYGGIKDRVGFIAEDVEPVFPNCVSYDATGTITGIDYSSFVPYIIEIVKQQAIEIEKLKSMIIS